MHAEATPIDWELLIAAVGQHKAITETQCVTLFMGAALWRSTLISFVLVRGNEQKRQTDHKETFRFVTEERNQCYENWNSFVSTEVTKRCSFTGIIRSAFFLFTYLFIKNLTKTKHTKTHHWSTWSRQINKIPEDVTANIVLYTNISAWEHTSISP